MYTYLCEIFSFIYVGLEMNKAYIYLIIVHVILNIDKSCLELKR